MTLEAQNFGAEYGIEAKDYASYSSWAPLTKPGEGFEGYEEAKVAAVRANAHPEKHRLCSFAPLHIRVVVYEYEGLVRKNVRTVTTIS